jgi:GrpB-like predicted nucleotidyltransferase (UPF0157 family)
VTPDSGDTTTPWERPPRTVDVVPYDQDWPRRFAAAHADLTRALPAALAVEHVGSTSVPGLSAKPTIDVLVVVDDVAALRADHTALAALGYEYRPRSFAAEGDHLFFRKVTAGVRTHHLHVLAAGSPRAAEYRLFRDFLRTHPDAVDRYERAKRALAERYATERLRYVVEKGVVVDALMVEAERWAESGT